MVQIWTAGIRPIFSTTREKQFQVHVKLSNFPGKKKKIILQKSLTTKILAITP